MWADFIDDCRNRGLLAAVGCRLLFLLFIVAFAPVWLPITLIGAFNDWTKTWFGGDPDA